MRVLAKQIAYVVAIAFAGTVLAYPWPFDHATSTQQVVRQTVGAYRADNRLHTGLDIQPLIGVSDSVYCIEEGTVIYVTPNGVRVGNPGLVYYHVVPDTSVKTDSLVTVGQLFGVLQELGSSTDHVHLAEGPYGPSDPLNENPLLSIATFADSLGSLMRLKSIGSLIPFSYLI